ncbi:WD40/YVTN/BNR-like repeat-containing protein [Pseudoduganella rivuli]|nr:YCF48-related protein [Pseudoduganella rivuli]
MNKRFALGAIAALACCAIGAGAAIGNSTSNSGLRDPIATPAPDTAFGAYSSLTAVTAAGSRLVAVGRRGVILASADAGQSWQQLPSPVSSDLTAVQFVDAQHGWIVGHDAVVLKTTDGGKTWERKLDGHAALALLNASYGPQGKTPDDAIAQDIERAGSQSATPGVLPYPLLSVWFSSANEGYVAGAFGLILQTRDGGASWTPMIERTANIKMNHIYAIGGDGGQVYLAGEQGFLRRLDDTTGAFVPMASPYEGSFFGLAASQSRLVVHGLRGNAYASDDGGARWRKIDTGSGANIVAALPVSAAAGAGLLLVTQTGDVLESSADGSARPYSGADSAGADNRRGQPRGEVYGAAIAGGALVATGMAGASVLRSVPLSTP